MYSYKFQYSVNITAFEPGRYDFGGRPPNFELKLSNFNYFQFIFLLATCFWHQPLMMPKPNPSRRRPRFRNFVSLQTETIPPPLHTEKNGSRRDGIQISVLVVTVAVHYI